MYCQCCATTLRVYRALRKLGQREDHAYDAAVQVFWYFHPERPRVDAYQIVADWLDRYEAGTDPGGHPWEAEPDTQ